jgi:hypothetical protein
MQYFAQTDLLSPPIGRARYAIWIKCNYKLIDLGEVNRIRAIREADTSSHFIRNFQVDIVQI